jgi:hypothetical protein
LPYSGSASVGLLSLTGGLTDPCTYVVNNRQTTALTTMTETEDGKQARGL